jgi:hypothetical protein
MLVTRPFIIAIIGDGYKTNYGKFVNVGKSYLSKVTVIFGIIQNKIKLVYYCFSDHCFESNDVIFLIFVEYSIQGEFRLYYFVNIVIYFLFQLLLFFFKKKKGIPYSSEIRHSHYKILALFADISIIFQLKFRRSVTIRSRRYHQ